MADTIAIHRDWSKSKILVEVIVGTGVRLSGKVKLIWDIRVITPWGVYSHFFNIKMLEVKRWLRIIAYVTVVFDHPKYNPTWHLVSEKIGGKLGPPFSDKEWFQDSLL